jgi:hypothetical protein
VLLRPHVASDAAKESWFAQKENRKTKSQGSGASGCKTLQSQTEQYPKNRITFNRLAVNHGRLNTVKQSRLLAAAKFEDLGPRRALKGSTRHGVQVEFQFGCSLTS